MDPTPVETGIELLKLASEAPNLFREQNEFERRQMLDILLSNCTWKHGELHADFKQPFDMIAENAMRSRKETAAGGASDGRCINWLPGTDSNRRPGG